MRFLYFLFSIFLLSCSNTNLPDKITIHGEAFGTTYVVKYFGNAKDAPFIKKGIDSVVYVVNKSMSTYLPESDISKINKGDTSVVIDSMFLEVFTLSRKLNKATSGYFDPTIGILRNAYGFGETKPLGVLDKVVLDSLMNYVGWDKVILNSNKTITKLHPEIYFDFNAIAKGYGIDRIVIFLESLSKTNFLVELGGEIRAKGKNISTDTSWRVGVESVNSKVENRSAVTSVALNNRSMAGSGNYRKYRVDKATGNKYVHTINPLTGTAEQIDILSANVIAPTCAEADAWATAFMAMGIEKSKKILDRQKDIEAYLTYSGGVYITPGFMKLLVE